jgi:hypothetical protein
MEDRICLRLGLRGHESLPHGGARREAAKPPLSRLPAAPI